MKYISLSFILSFLLIVSANASDYKKAPLPHYDRLKEYGWSTTVPADKPSNVQSILKVWNVYSSRYVFVDGDKDGTCDFVFGFRKTGTQNEDGKDLYRMIRPQTCEEAEEMIKNFLDIRKSE